MDSKEKNKLLLNYLRNLVQYGGDIMEKNPQILEKLSLKQTYLYVLFAAINSYSEAILVLCENYYPDAAIVIIRSIVEAYIRSVYVLSHNSDNRLIFLSLNDSFNRAGWGKELSIFIKKYPKKKGDILNNAFLSNLKNKTNAEIKIYEKKLGKDRKELKSISDKQKNLLSLTRIADKRFKKGDFEYTYHVAYRYLSSYAHLSVRGINNFLFKKKGGYGLIAGKSKDIGLVIKTNYIIYLYFLDTLKKRKLIKEKVTIKKFNNIFDKEFRHNVK